MTKITRFSFLRKKHILFLVLTFFTINISDAQQKESSVKPEFLNYENSKWVDSVMQTLTPEQRIGQLFMLPAYSDERINKAEILNAIKNHSIGGLIFMQGGPGRQVALMNEYQKASKVPIIGAMDAEWGLGMRLDSTMNFSYQMALGAIQNDSLIYQMGREIGRQLKRVGLQINFAPVVDVNNNPKNPVINYRSFGEDKYKVATKGLAYMRGLQDEHVLSTAKHFPGHGDTGTDSHLALPQINSSLARMDTLELYPFKQLIAHGMGGVMIAHLDIPSMDASGLPSTLSKKIVTGILQDTLGFQGLIVTDAMNMKGVTKGRQTGVVDKDALVAGNDMIEFTEDLDKAINEVKKAIKNGEISQKTIDARCRKILALKQWVGLDQYSPTSDEHVYEDIHSAKAQLLQRDLVEASLTVLNNKNDLIPLKHLDTLKIASVSIGSAKESVFQNYLGMYADVQHFQLSASAKATEIQKLQDRLKGYNLVITGIHDSSIRPGNSVKFSSEVLDFIAGLSAKKNSIISLFKNPYTIDKFKNIEKAAVLIVAYQDSPLTQEMAAQLIFGGIGASGRLPVTVGNKYKAGEGMDIKGGIRFKYTIPEDAGMRTGILVPKVDSLMQQAMDAKAIPGGQILVARNQKIVLYKAYGVHEYSDTVKVKKTDLYDLASVTKISSALPVLMQLADEGKFDLQKGIDDYLPYFKHSNKAEIPFRQILAHQARFAPWIPYWRNTLRKNGSYRWNTFKKDSSRRYPVKVEDNMWLHRNYKTKKMFKAIKKSPLLEEAKYTYSGLAFYLLPTIVEEITDSNFVDYLDRHFYDKLGATTLTYNPLNKFPLDRIVPTESDFLFRHREIHGNVHDEGAIMMGGVSANAGLFTNANDLAKLLQMYLNMGEYGGERFIETATFKEWTKTQFPDNDNRRAIGFDKPNLKYSGLDNNTAKDASPASFGHTGFTGIMVWMDPKEDLLYIFMSNRVLPTRDNTRLYTMNTRTQIQQVLYEAMGEE